MAGPWFKVLEAGNGWTKLEDSMLWFSTGDTTFRGWVESRVDFAQEIGAEGEGPQITRKGTNEEKARG